MKHILSIDFDWIMRPDIELYNNYCGASHDLRDLEEMWKFVAHKTQYKSFHCSEEQLADLMLFTKKITQFLPQDHIHFILHHDEVLDILNSKGIDEKIILTNIDHHHDFGYRRNDDEKPFDKFATVANWVKCLYNEQRLERYIWVGNENSDGIKPMEEKLQNQFTFFTNLRPIEQYKYDEVIICFSQEWIPPNVRPLFYVFKEFILCGKEEQ